MNNLLDMVLGSQNSGAIGQIAKNLNIDAGDATKALGSLLPALQGGMKNNVAQGGLDSLLGALTGGKSQQFIEQPEMMGQQQAVDNGNSILGHLLGSKDASRQVASQAAESTGLDTSMLKKMLPMAATMLMGSMGQQTQQKNSAEQPSMIAGLLDQDGDGSMVDDVLGLAGKLFR